MVESGTNGADRAGGRSGLRLALLGAVSVMAFVAAFYLRMNAAYGPFNLGLHPAEWTVLWELFLYGQISTRVVVESGLAGILAGAAPWLVDAGLRRSSSRR